MVHTLPPLPYPTDALEPYIDKMTMEIHHGTHHAAYVKKLNAALETHPELASKDLDELLRTVHALPSDIRSAIRNNGGGHANHSLFWITMGPNGGGTPTGRIASAIDSSFRNFEEFKKQFSKAALEHFGSGWAWAINQGDRIAIETTPNQDSPLMDGKVPLFGLDVWEHAYYLRYQSRRVDYIDAWWHVVDWVAIGKIAERQAVGATR
jgi:Fe-Mn family superoxide dismutase